MESGHIIIHEEYFPLSLNGTLWRMHCACKAEFEAPTEQECRKLIGTHVYNVTRIPEPEESPRDLAGLQSRTNILMDMCLAQVERIKALERCVNQLLTLPDKNNIEVIHKLEALEAKVSDLGERADYQSARITEAEIHIGRMEQRPDKNYLEVLQTYPNEPIAYGTLLWRCGELFRYDGKNWVRHSVLNMQTGSETK